MHDPGNEERAEHAARAPEQPRGRLGAADDERALEHLVPPRAPKVRQAGREPGRLEERRPLLGGLAEDGHRDESDDVVGRLEGRAEPERADERHGDHFSVAPEGRQVRIEDRSAVGVGGVFGGGEIPRLLGEENKVEERLRRHVSYEEVDRALRSGLCGRRDVYAFAPVPPYAARVECQVKGVQQGAFKLGRIILGSVGWKPGESLPHEYSRLGGKVDRAEHQEREKPLARTSGQWCRWIRRLTYANGHAVQVVSRLFRSIEIVPRRNSPGQRAHRN